MTAKKADHYRVHHTWNRAQPPVVRVESGDEVAFTLNMAGHGQVQRDSTADSIAWDFSTLYHLGGPVFVEGAEPGDTLAIDILELKPGPWGWTGILPGMGLLPERFPDPYLRIFELGRGYAEVADGLRIPLDPFLGTLGVALDVEGDVDVFPPHAGGGNLDTRHLTVGARLLLPVQVEGALFSCGDPHGVQGDGEVCVSALECPMKARVRLTVLKTSLSAPSYELPDRPGPGPVRGTMGIADDLMEASRRAVSAMIDWLVAEHPLSEQDAYVVCSLAGDLRIHEIVDAGVWNVGFQLPLRVFD